MLRSLIALALLLPLPARAQQPLVESIEVRVVNIDVVVTDKSGKPVTGLTVDDFEVLEDGKKQKITNFFEARAGAAQTMATETTTVEARPRRFVLFIDNYTLHPDVRAEVVSSLEQFVDRHLAPRDEASIVSWNRTLEILTPFTSDKSELKAGLAKAATIGSVASVSSPLARVQARCMRAVDAMRSGRMSVQLAYHECISAARDHTEELIVTSRQLMGAINTTLHTLAGFEGRKVLVLAGAQLPVKPGLEIYQWANLLFQPYMRGSTRR
jgi:VWFA-related protein